MYRTELTLGLVRFDDGRIIRFFGLGFILILVLILGLEISQLLLRKVLDLADFRIRQGGLVLILIVLRGDF